MAEAGFAFLFSLVVLHESLRLQTVLGAQASVLSPEMSENLGLEVLSRGKAQRLQNPLIKEYTLYLIRVPVMI